MRPAVIDTDVVSFLFKDDSRTKIYLPRFQNRPWLISFMTEAELEQWVLLANWGATRVEWLRLFLGRFVIVPSSRDLAELRRRMPGSRQRLCYMTQHF
jgi:tRNA(fMet)-specific endonuclease VapC